MKSKHDNVSYVHILYVFAWFSLCERLQQIINSFTVCNVFTPLGKRCSSTFCNVDFDFIPYFVTLLLSLKVLHRRQQLVIEINTIRSCTSNLLCGFFEKILIDAVYNMGPIITNPSRCCSSLSFFAMLLFALRSISQFCARAETMFHLVYATGHRQ